jgi:hypothetical protein
MSPRRYAATIRARLRRLAERHVIADDPAPEPSRLDRMDHAPTTDVEHDDEVMAVAEAVGVTPDLPQRLPAWLDTSEKAASRRRALEAVEIAWLQADVKGMEHAELELLTLASRGRRIPDLMAAEAEAFLAEVDPFGGCGR